MADYQKDKAMVAYLKANPHKKTYSDYPRAVREAEKEESMELSQNPCSQAIDNTTKPKATSLFPLWKLKGNQPVSKMATVHLEYLEEESPKRGYEEEIKDPNSIDRVTEEFMVCLAWALEDAQVEEKHFICNCLLVKAPRENMQLNSKEVMVLRKGVLTPQMKMTMPKNPQ